MNFHTNLCFHYVSTGDCPYNDRCSYIHDPRICSGIIGGRIASKNIDNDQSYFYPPKFDPPSKTPNIEYHIDDNNKFHLEKKIWDCFVKTIEELNKENVRVNENVSFNENVRVNKNVSFNENVQESVCETNTIKTNEKHNDVANKYKSKEVKKTDTQKSYSPNNEQKQSSNFSPNKGKQSSNFSPNKGKYNSFSPNKGKYNSFSPNKGKYNSFSPNNEKHNSFSQNKWRRKSYLPTNNEESKNEDEKIYSNNFKKNKYYSKK